MTQSSVENTLEEARDAIRRHAWREAFDLLTAIDASDGLSAEDLERLAESAWWTGRLDDCIQARERSFVAYMEQGNSRRAAFVAIELVFDHYGKLAPAVAAGWSSRAIRLLETEPDCV